MCVCACVRVCVRAYVRACVRVCVENTAQEDIFDFVITSAVHRESIIYNYNSLVWFLKFSIEVVFDIALKWSWVLYLPGDTLECLISYTQAKWCLRRCIALPGHFSGDDCLEYSNCCGVSWSRISVGACSYSPSLVLEQGDRIISAGFNDLKCHWSSYNWGEPE